MAGNQTFVIIGVHKGFREVVVWAGKDGFVPITRMQAAQVPPRVREISGDVAEELMSHITRMRSNKYEWVLVPVIRLADPAPGRSEAGLILPHLH